MSFESPKEEAKNKDNELSEAPLSPEQIEKIMEKVVDIAEFNKFGFHSIHRVDEEEKGVEVGKLLRLKQVLEDGVLGFSGVGNPKNPHGRGRGLKKEKWAAQTKARRENPFFFHINRYAGKLVSERRGGVPFDVRREVGSEEEIRITVVFDFSKFKERFTETEAGEIEKKRQETGDGGERSYPYGSVVSGIPNQPMYNEKGEEAPTRALTSKEFEDNMQQGYFQPHHEFLAYSRVAPRFFKGICVAVSDKLERDEIVEKVVGVMRDTYEDDEGLLLPIYDGQGNLLWPEKMDYENIKKLAKEHEKVEGDALEERRLDGVE